MSNRPHKNLEVWKLSIQMVKEFYQVLEKFPADEKYGITSQLKRACVSVPANIAEGAARTSKQEYHYFLSIAAGSLSEVDTLLELSKELKMITDDEFKNLMGKIETISALLNGLMKYVKS